MAKILELNGLIHRKYDNESKMADAMGWSRQRLNKITNGGKAPSLEEIESMSIALEEPVMNIVDIFLRSKSPNGQLLEKGGEKYYDSRGSDSEVPSGA